MAGNSHCFGLVQQEILGIHSRKGRVVEVKTITQTRLQEMNPCSGGFIWYKANFSSGRHNALNVVNKLIGDDKFQWANWFISRCMNHSQKVRYAIFAAEQVIKIFEKKYPNDRRPRKAIQAAKASLKVSSKKNLNVAAYAAVSACVFGRPG